MPSAEIIAIGTELLLGEIVDTNSHYIARNLRDLGVDLFRTSTVGDNAQRIASLIRESLGRAEIIITTGGLGPTVDDPTRDAVALAFGVPTEYRPELWEQIRRRFARFGRLPTENNKRQAYVPQGAVPMENPVGTAPCFIMETPTQAVISLPGVPSEMEYLMQNAVLPYLRQRFDLRGVIKARVLHTAGAGESQIDDLIGDLEELSNPTVGLAAHAGQVDVRITAKADSLEAANSLIAPVEADLHQRLGDWIYGADADTLESVALAALSGRGWTLAAVEAGMGGELLRKLTAAPAETFRGGETLAERPQADDFCELVETYRQGRGADVGLGVLLHPGPEKQEVFIVLITPTGAQQFARPYGGPPNYGSRWAVNHALNLIRGLEKMTT
jgi:competence/damage-inducible protein CinA-like protein